MSLTLRAVVRERDLDAELEVAAGETVALLGANGAGKSTLLSVAAGLLRPDEGSVVVDGRRLTAVGGGAETSVPPHRREVALLAQEPLLFPHLDALANVAFGPRSRGASRRESASAARRWLDALGVGELAGRRPRQLSGGQAQRVALARALATEPRLLLLDEPMAALDVAVRPALRQTLRRVLVDRTTVLVTHDVLDALLLADRVVVLDRGRVVEDGRTADVLARPRSAFAARLAGLNLVGGVWRDGHVRTDAGLEVQGLVSGPTPRRGEQVVAAFRPHAVAVYHRAPEGSPRNAFHVRVESLEPLGDLVRVRAGELSADVTAAAVADLDLLPGAPVTFTVKATEVDVYGL